VRHARIHLGGRAGAGVLIALAGMLAGASPLLAQLVQPSNAPRALPMVVVDDALNMTLSDEPIRLDERTLTFRVEGVERTLPRERVLALGPAEWVQDRRAGGRTASVPAGDSGQARLTFTDGSRLHGVVPMTAFAPETFVLRHARLGVLSFALEEIAGFDSDAEFPLPDRAPGRGRAGGDGPSGDVAVLSNGDRLEGFLVGLVLSGTDTEPGAPAIRFETSGPGQTERTGGGAGDGSANVRTIPLSRVSALRLANPSVPAVGARVWMSDGSSPRVASIGTITPTRWNLSVVRSPGSGAIELGVPSWNVQGAVLDSAALVALSRLPAPRVTLPTGRRWSEPVLGVPGAEDVDATQHAGVADVRDVLLPGPMAAAWTLPTGAMRVAGVLVLPEDSRTWGDCTVRLSLERGASTTVLLSQRLSTERPEHAFNVELGGQGEGVLRVEVDAGPSGPVQDRVVLRRVLIAVARPQAGAGPDARPDAQPDAGAGGREQVQPPNAADR